ncbi:cytochrome P450 [Trichoderma pleuroticola]
MRGDCVPKHVLLLLMTHLHQKWTTSRRHHIHFWGYNLLMGRIKAAKDGRQLALYMKHYSIYGKAWEENFLGKRVINTMETKNIQHVASSGLEDYGKGSNAMDGPEWKHSRDITKPIFSRSELSDVERLDFHIDRLVNFIPRDGSMIDLQDLTNKMANANLRTNYFIDSSSEILLGKSMDLQLNDDDSNDAVDYLTAFQACLVGLGNRLHNYTGIQIKRALEKISGTEAKSESRYVLIHELAKQIQDPIQLRSQILQIWVPSRDTTALVVNSSIFQLAQRPEIWEQLRVESLAIGDEPIIFEPLPSLKLFKYVVYETLRLQAPPSRVQKVAVRDTILPVGGGPDDFVPFLGGPRIYLAQQRVLTHCVQVLVRLTREFSRIENQDPVMESVEMWRLLPESRNGIKVALFI